MRIPLGSHETELVVRRSRFIARGDPLGDPAAVRDRVAQVRGSHAGCDHVVWAFVSGLRGENEGMSDDHEPHGTAGRPVLDVLRGSGITNILLTVTRFFGGTKLGTGGLVKAYSEAAKRVLAGIATRDYVERREFLIALPYESYELVRRLAAEMNAGIDAEEFVAEVTIRGTIPESVSEDFAQQVRNATSGRARMHLFDRSDDG